jgi:hypothetical protein
LNPKAVKGWMNAQKRATGKVQAEKAKREAEEKKRRDAEQLRY